MEKLIDNRIGTYVIDNDPNFISICKIVVNENEHFKMVGASCSLKGAGMLKDNNVRLLIVDVTNLSREDYNTLFDIKTQCNYEIGILVTSSTLNESMLKYLQIGLAGFITKATNEIVMELSKSLCDIYENRIALSRKVSKLIVESFWREANTCPLSVREVDIMCAASKGKTYAEISKELSLSIETTKSYFKKIYYKLDVNSKSDAIILAASNKWI